MKVLLHSVPGTGTRFVSHVLEEVFRYRSVSFRELESPDAVGDIFALVHAHLVSRFPDELPTGTVVITPLRNPCLQHFTRCEGMPVTIDRWKTLMAQDGKHSTLYFPVDTDLDRSILLNKLRDHLKADDWDVEKWLDVLMFWEVIGSSGTTRNHTEYLETGKVKGIDLTPLKFAVDWYKSKIYGE